MRPSSSASTCSTTGATCCSSREDSIPSSTWVSSTSENMSAPARASAAGRVAGAAFFASTDAGCLKALSRSAGYFAQHSPLKRPSSRQACPSSSRSATLILWVSATCKADTAWSIQRSSAVLPALAASSRQRLKTSACSAMEKGGPVTQLEGCEGKTRQAKFLGKNSVLPTLECGLNLLPAGESFEVSCNDF